MSGVMQRRRVLFVCTGNSARSQMAEALLREEGGEAFEPVSAGTRPAAVNPLTVRALQELGIDGTGLQSKSVEGFVGGAFDDVVTVCDDARESCPFIPGARRTLHWSLEDPAAVDGTEEERMIAFRRVRDDLAGRVRAFVAELGETPRR